MLIYTDRKPAKGTLDRKVKYTAQGFCRIWPDLEDFERVFTFALAQMKQLNHVHPQLAYRLIRTSKTIEVWHVSPEELIPDRLLCTIEYVDDIEVMIAEEMALLK